MINNRFNVVYHLLCISKNKFIQMKKEIKIGDKTFELKSPNILDKSTTDMMNDWCRLVEKQKNDEDVWTGMHELPQYKFKNLKIESSPFETMDETNEMSITFKYNEYIELNEYDQIKNALEDLTKDLNTTEAKERLKNWTKK
jgi:hypothetical protein